MGWLGSGCTGTSLTCTVTVNGPQTVSATFAPQTTVATLDIGATTSGPKYRPTTDGVLVLRHMLGMTGNALINGAIGAAATRTSAAAITTYLTDVLPMLDIDGNGQASAMTDGLLVMRSMFGFTGAALINGVVGSGATRPAATQIENYLRLLMP